jgi:Arm DNA-binding domain
MGKLTAVAVRAAKHDPTKKARPIRIGDGDGLYLQIAPGGTKSWLLRYMLNGKQREMGLGPVGDPPQGVPLATARVRAGEARALLREHRDPLIERQAAQAARRQASVDATQRTFKAAAVALAESKRAG